MAESNYYKKKLSGKRLQRCYQIAPPRVGQYLEAEIRKVLECIKPSDTVIELGCGYGRVTLRLGEVAKRTIGVDLAADNIALARELDPDGSCEFFIMNALTLEFPDNYFDVVVCIQNGICAFNVDQQALVSEALRVTRKDGLAIFSSYADPFWPKRLAWFEVQSSEGLIGPIDYEASVNGFIVCTDGFRSGRLTANDFRRLCLENNANCEITEIDASSIFCVVTK